MFEDLSFADDPLAREYVEQPTDIAVLEASWLQRFHALPERPERIFLEQDQPLREREPDSLTDAEAITRLVEVEAGIARSHALRARLVALVAAQRPGAAPTTWCRRYWRSVNGCPTNC